jgi:hypothetical protein
MYELFFEIRNFIDKFSDQLKTHILCRVKFSETGACDKKMCTVLYWQTYHRQQCNRSYGFSLQDNKVYRHNLIQAIRKCVQPCTERQTTDSNVIGCIDIP